MRNRIVELLNESAKEVAKIFKAESDECLARGELPQHKRTIHEIEADYLLENNTIALPCNVGDKLYSFWHPPAKNIVEYEVIVIQSSIKDKWIITYKKIGSNTRRRCTFSDVGKKVFRTREECARALKGGEG